MSLENVLKKVVQEIIRELSHRNLQIKEIFVKYYASLLVLDPNWGVSKNVLHNRLKIQKFVKFVTYKLVKSYTPDIVTLKIQLYFSLNFEDRAEMVRKAKLNLIYKMTPLQKEIAYTKVLDNAKVMRKFYRKIIYYVTLLSGMGNPTYEPVYKEVQAALKSVVTDGEINEFLTKTPSIKKEQLQEFVELVAGIRLFNRDCGRGGEGIDDVPKLLQKSLEIMGEETQKTLLSIMQRVNALTTLLDICYVTRRFKEGLSELVCVVPEGISGEDVIHLKNLLVLYRQYEILIRKIIAQLSVVEDMMETIGDRFKEAMDRVHMVVQGKIAVPAFQVFPIFREVACIWFDMQDEAILLAKYNEIMANIAVYVKESTVPDAERNDALIEQLLGNAIPQSDADRMREVSHTSIRPLSSVSDFQLVPVENFRIIDSVEFEYLGFCAWKIVESDGALIPGNPNIGVLQGDGKNYVFSSDMALNTFTVDPRNNVLKFFEMVRRHPEMINLLQVYDALVAVRDIEELIPPLEFTAEVQSVEVQTLVHPIEERIDPTYKWNVWDLKRDALLLAQLSHCQTVSTQTDESCGSCPAKVQTVYPREKGCQTKRDNYTNVPKPSTYVFGLRGRTDDKQFKVDLTRPVEE